MEALDLGEDKIDGEIGEQDDDDSISENEEKRQED